ncbi:MAG: winged helix-turn-helix transcriptional regulator, partial [Acidimicrobiia bacterium]
MVPVDARRQYSDHLPRSEYLLTEKGRDLFPVLVTLMQWGDRWAAEDGPPIRLVHELCEHVASPRLACEHCGGDVAPATEGYSARPQGAALVNRARHNCGPMYRTTIRSSRISQMIMWSS